MVAAALFRFRRCAATGTLFAWHKGKAMSDGNDLQGFWKIETMTGRGQAVGHGDTHWEFNGDRVLQILPDYVDGGTWATFTLDETATPKRMEHTYTFPTENGGTRTQTHKQCYELSGDTLRVGGAVVYGEYPPAIEDAVSTVTTLSRYFGERPAVRQASGTKPLQSASLGVVTWNDNFNRWEAQIEIVPGQKVGVSLAPGDAAEIGDIAAGEAFVQWVREQDAAARAYAAKQMVETAEDWQEQDDEETEPITVESFARRIRLSEITTEPDGEGSLWYDDDGIFAGHVIVVSVNAEREFTDATMMG